MGVPKFFAWLMRNYKKSKFIFQKEKVDMEPIDWFLIDTNCLIHPTCFKILAEEQNSKTKINFKSLEKIIKLLDENVENSYAIDWLFIKLQPWLNTFAFYPGMAKQIDGQSDIMGGVRKFSDFSYLGDHWFSESL
jgi:hypothetical protein